MWSKITAKFGSSSNSAFEKSLIGTYPGTGSTTDPFLVSFVRNDPADAMNLPAGRRWLIFTIVSVAALIVTFSSSAYHGSETGIVEHFHISRELAIAGISLYVLGFAVGPLLWAPLSEMYGRYGIFVASSVGMTVFAVGTACAQSTPALLVLRFFTGAFGASCMTNSPGTIADMFDASMRGMATGIFATAPFLGPALGPMLGGFLGETQGWRWPLGLMAILSGVITILGILFTCETYGPVLLRRRAERLSRITGQVYISALDAGKPPMTVARKLRTAVGRQFVLLFTEPVVLISSIYITIIYGTLYLNFAAYPIVFQRVRGWSTGIGGLAFTGTAIGVFLATAAAYVDYMFYLKSQRASKTGVLPPEYRLRSTIVGSFLLPIGLFWFAWTCGPEIHWIVPIIGSVFFACGLVMVFMSLLNYLVDSYVVYAASVMAANSVMRSIVGASFPSFTIYMYENLGLHWAGSVPGFLALACVPLPILFFKYGARIRRKCKFAAEAAQVLEKMQEQRIAAAKASAPTAKEGETTETASV